jgi:putative ABC transport system permease protein
MFKNYLKIAFRNIWKSKAYAFINILGLSVAFCVSVFLFLTAYFQLTFDDFLQDGDRIFQTYLFSNDPEKTARSGSMPFPLTPALKSEFPEIEGVARLVNGGELVEYNGKYFDKRIKYTDSDFFKVFSFPLVQGDRTMALRDLSSIVISQLMAKAVFGTEQPMGKALQVGTGSNKKQYIVTGVLEDFPDNSSIRTDAFMRVENAGGYQSQKDQWDAHSHQVFLKLSPKVDKATFEKRLQSFTAKYFTDYLENLKKRGAKPDERGDILAIRLQNLANVHFDTEISDGRGTAPITLVYALLGIAFFILLIACINFINLNVARSFVRAREVGVRKSLGALKNQLFFQVWGEAAVICFLGFLAGLLLTVMLLPTFNATFKSKLSLVYMAEPDKIMLITCIFVFVTMIAGGYPAWQMSKFNAVEVLKGKVTLKKPGVLRNALIVTQFTLSSLLICSTIIAFQQVNHLRKQPLGI